MVVKEEKQRLHRLLADAIPVLCKSSLPLKTTFCIEALIGITLDDDEVVLVSFKQEIGADLVVSENVCQDLERKEGEGQTEMTEKVFAKPRRLSSKAKQQSEQITGNVEGSYKRISIAQEGSSLYLESSEIPSIKVEAVDVKMEEDVQITSTAGCLGFDYRMDGEFADGVPWSAYEHGAQAAFADEISEDVEDDGGIISRGKWSINGRYCGKAGRRKAVRPTACSSSVSNLVADRVYNVPEASASDWNWSEGRSAVAVVTGAQNPSSMSMIGDVGVDGQLESSSEAQETFVGQIDFQSLDERVSLEQTCKILSSYRFSSAAGDDNLYSCHICEAKLRGRQTLYEHIRGTHLCARIYKCPNCGLSFKWRSGLQRHRAKCNTGAPATISLIDT